MKQYETIMFQMILLLKNNKYYCKLYFITNAGNKIYNDILGNFSITNIF